MKEMWDAVIDEHNKIREEAGAPEMIGDEQIHLDAQKHADFLAQADKFEKTTLGGKYTCNLAGSSKQNAEEAMRECVQRLADCNDFKKYLNPAIRRVGVGVARNNYSNVWVLCIFYEQPKLERQTSRNF